MQSAKYFTILQRSFISLSFMIRWFLHLYLFMIFICWRHHLPNKVTRARVFVYASTSLLFSRLSCCSSPLSSIHSLAIVGHRSVSSIFPYNSSTLVHIRPFHNVIRISRNLHDNATPREPCFLTWSCVVIFSGTLIFIINTNIVHTICICLDLLPLEIEKIGTSILCYYKLHCPLMCSTVVYLQPDVSMHTFYCLQICIWTDLALLNLSSVFGCNVNCGIELWLHMHVILCRLNTCISEINW